METIYERIKNLCYEKGVTIKRCERECNLANGTIARYKDNNIQPTFGVCTKLSAYFNVTYEYILTGIDKTADCVIANDEFEEILLLEYRNLQTQDKLYLLKYLEELKENNKK